MKPSVPRAGHPLGGAGTTRARKDGRADAIAIPIPGPAASPVTADSEPEAAVAGPPEPATLGNMIVVGEDVERIKPLLTLLRSQGVTTTLLNTASASFVSDGVPPSQTVWLSRQSPSAEARGNPRSIAFARVYLGWLALYGCRVVNGMSALTAQDLETSKALQMAALTRAGINTPRTILYTSLDALLRGCSTDWRDDQPLLVKPDTGGSGQGVKPFATRATLAAAVLRGDITFPQTGAGVVVQEHLYSYSTNPERLRTVLRFEIVGGELLYVLQITAPVTEFALCPCLVDVTGKASSVATNRTAQFRIIPDPLTIPCFTGAPKRFARFRDKLLGLWKSVGAEVGAAEAFLPTSYTDDGKAGRVYAPCSTLVFTEPVVFDLNFNTNYNEDAEKQANLFGFQATAAVVTAALAASTPSQTA